MKFLLALFFLAPAPLLAAPYVVACGEGREQGAEKAEIALVDDMETQVKFYLRGEALPLESFDLATRNGAWIITVPGGPGRKDRKFEIHEGKKQAQEYLLLEKGEKPVGKPKPCLIPEL